MSSTTKNYSITVRGDRVEVHEDDYNDAEIPLDLFLAVAGAVIPWCPKGIPYPGTLKLNWSEPRE